MQKKFTSLGLMSGTSGDGVDASIIVSDGTHHFEVIKDKFFEYDSKISKKIHSTKEKIFNIKDLENHSKELSNLEREITLFHAKIVKEITNNYNDILIGFHGQTIYHNSENKTSKQLGDGKLLNQLTKKKIVYDFRSNDILNGGEGAPLTPIFHQLIAVQKNLPLPICFLNIGGISNITIISQKNENLDLFSRDLGPGNCLIDKWMRKNSNLNFDISGKISSSGKINHIILEQAQELYANRININKLSFDTSDFDISFARGLSLEDGAATLTDFTARIISEELSNSINKINKNIKQVLLCGGGRKNNFLVKKIRDFNTLKVKIRLIEDYNLNGDFIESQAFAFLAIRSFLNLPISFPNTTGCSKPSSGGRIITN